MDALRADDVARARGASPEARAAQTLELIRAGIRLKRSALRARSPHATEDEIDAKLRAWLKRDA